jgi:pimeloyl-ACP methyl ester carboxylesterase
VNWLLLRGLVREQRHWGRFREVFEHAVPDAKSFCLDLPGVGTECKRSSPATINGIVQDLHARWEQLRKDHGGAWACLGISLGGMVALRWVELYPRDFERLVVINTSAADLSPPHWRLNWHRVPGVLRSALVCDAVEREKIILGMTTALLGDSLAPMAREWAGYAQERATSRSTALRQLVAALRFVSPADLKIPALVLSSAKDRFTNPQCSARLAERLGAPQQIHSAAGHDITLDDPEWVSEQIALWMRS